MARKYNVCTPKKSKVHVNISGPKFRNLKLYQIIKCKHNALNMWVWSFH